MTIKFSSDIDIDVGQRDNILSIIKHTPASMHREGVRMKHMSGIYPTEIPKSPYGDFASFDYIQAEELGYVKLDLLNVSLYEEIESEELLLKLMSTEPNWDKLQNKSFCQQLIHIGNSYNILTAMPEPVNSIPRLAMFLAVIRPGKKHLIGKTWKEVAETVWEKDDTGFAFKKSHSISYSQLVVVHMNLLDFSNKSDTSAL